MNRADGLYAANPDLDRATGKVFRRLLPILMACYVLAFLDRINFGFAALSMNRDLGLTVAQFGLAGTIFYVAYFCFEVPSNLLMVRFGARLWIARIMVTWGLASMATALISGPMGLYIVRGLLGLGEAGFVPGVLLYLTYWMPARHRGRATSLFMMAQPIAIAIGSPISGLIMDQMHGALGLRGWQWLFLIEGTPTILLGVALLRLLPDRPETAAWLSPAEASALKAQLASEPSAGGHHGPQGVGLRDVLNAPFIALSGAYFALVAALSTVSNFSPLILKDIFGAASGPMTVGLVAAMPGLAAVLVMPFLSASSDRRQERGWHFVGAAGAAALGWFATTLTGAPAFQILGLIAATAGGYAAMPILWTLPPVLLRAAARPVGIAVISSAGIAGSIVSPVLNGHLRQATGSYVTTGWYGAGCMALALILVALSVRLQKRAGEGEA
ncbi:MFS transporter [Phenylobacterium immobile]|uniref:MFS transporter n=1 Tax=Phenylobacterium immobile TaxID=21 RepID=UPI000A3EE7F1|nr:MFS transporter [Phenylobacterium immobile]